MAVIQGTATPDLFTPSSIYSAKRAKESSSEGLAAFSSSTITKDLKDKKSYPLFSAPKLPSIEFACIQLMSDFHTLGHYLIQSSIEESRLSAAKMNEYIQTSAKLIQEAGLRAQESQIWALLQKTSSCLLGAFNLLMGASLVGSGAPVIGAALIGAGLLAISNTAMIELKGWNVLAKQIAEENKELEEKILLYGPIALDLLSTALGLVCGGTAILNADLFKMLDLEEKTAIIIQTAINLYGSISSAGKGINDARHSWTQGDLSENQRNSTQESFQRDLIHNWMKDFLQTLNKNWEAAKNFIQLQPKVTS